MGEVSHNRTSMETKQHSKLMTHTNMDDVYVELWTTFIRMS
jgi:hypothetical protein